LAPDDLPWELLASHADRLPEPLAGATADQAALAELIGALRRYSLIKVTGDGLSTHRLLQAVIRENLDVGAQQQWAAAATGLLRDSFPEESDDVRTWPACQRLLPHVLAATGHAERLSVQAALEDTSLLLDRAAAYQRGRAQFIQAKAWLEQALAIDEIIHEPNDPNLAAAHSNLGLVLQDLGQFQGAKTHHEQALAIAEAAYGPDRPEVAAARGNLGVVLRALGDFTGAKAQYERALAIAEAAYGPDHPNVGIDRNNLGMVLRDLGDFTGAKAQFERALAIAEAAYGPDHPNVAIIRDSLAELERSEADHA
jgi:tetratricopeptide (TPR) repeat protein